MTAYLASLAVGIGVGIAYALLGVKSPAPPVIALVGLLGMVGGEIACQRILTAVRHKPVPNEVNMSSKPIVTAGYGAAFGFVFQFFTHESLVPLAGLDVPPWQQPLREHTSEFFTHVLYGVATEVTRRAVRRRL